MRLTHPGTPQVVFRCGQHTIWQFIKEMDSFNHLYSENP